MVVTDLNNEEVIGEYTLDPYEEINTMLIDDENDALLVGTMFEDK